jgi:hypothetical protein
MVEFLDVGIVFQFMILWKFKEFVTLLEASKPFFQSGIEYQSLNGRLRYKVWILIHFRAKEEGEKIKARY